MLNLQFIKKTYFQLFAAFSCLRLQGKLVIKKLIKLAIIQRHIL